MQSFARFQELLEDYVDDLASSEERHELLVMVKSGEYQGALEQHITATFGAEHLEGPVLSTWQKENILQKIFAEARLAAPVIAMDRRRKRSVWRWAAAAAILVTVTVGTGIFRSYRADQVAVTTPVAPDVKQEEIVPGGYRAELTLGDESVIALDKAKDGALLRQGNTQLSSVNGQELVYTNQGTNDINVVYNKISTPRGGQYRIVLPDGSKVWLNAASTLRFPIAFAGEERNVQLSGEAYFEVNPHPASNGGQQKIPFTVSVNGVKVTVLGTHFNVMAYADEAVMKTTLLEGAVKISSGKESSLLKPGQQAQVRSDATGQDLPPAGIKVSKADVNSAVAWKNGAFDFDGADIPAVMRQIARWYNVEVVYENGLPPAKQFDGKISRESTIADLVKILETNGIHVRVEARARKIVVLS